MKDFLNQDLELGDFVVMVYSESKRFHIAKIIKFTPKMVRIEFITRNWNKETVQSPEDLIKLHPEQVTWYLLTQGTPR